MNLDFTQEIAAALAYTKAKGTLLLNNIEAGEVSYLLHPFKIIFRSRSAAQANTIRIELHNTNKAMTLYPMQGRIKLGDITVVGPQALSDRVDLAMSPSRFIGLFRDASVTRAWHGRHQVDNTVADVVEALVGAAYNRLRAAA